MKVLSSMLRRMKVSFTVGFALRANRPKSMGMRCGVRGAFALPFILATIIGCFAFPVYAGTISLGDAQGIESDGVVRVPMTLAGDDGSAGDVTWEAVSGSAVLNEDFSNAVSQVVSWSGVGNGTQFFEIPLVKDWRLESVESFAVRIVSATGATIERGECTVSILDPKEPLSPANSAATSVFVRVEGREGYAREWAAEEHDGKTVIDTATTIDEGGRLTGDTVWTSNKVHIVRNWVTIPIDTTLTIESGTIVKFVDGAGIRVEDNGKLNVIGLEDDHVLFATVDDSERTEAPVYVMPYATFTDNGYLETKNIAMSQWGGVSVLDIKPLEQSGIVYVPVTIDTTRTGRFSVTWTATDGTAKLGEDYTLASGTLVWNGAETGTQFLEIPIVVDGVKEVPETFTITLANPCGINLTKATATITIVDSDLVVKASDFGESDTSATARVEGRDGFTRQWWSAECEGQSFIDTATTADEGGRLTNDVTWASNVVHLVRNYVTVPNGVTLTITEGAVVQFTTNTAIRVEDGGKLNVVGSAAARAVFTVATEDALTTAPVWLQTSAVTFADNGYLETQGITMSQWGSASIEDTKAIEVCGTAYVPITINTSRGSLFSVDWEAIDGTAIFGDDYTLGAGTVSWNAASEGTKTIAIPITLDTLAEGTETFTIRLKNPCGVNLGRAEATVTIVDSALTVKASDFGESAASDSVRVEGREGYARNWWSDECEGKVFIDSAANVDEGGRLSDNETWDVDKVHIVRNWVAIPNGITLTINAGVLVKFVDGAGFRVEDGGKLSVVGAEDARVTFTTVEETDRTDAPVYKMPSGSFAENGYLAACHMNVSQWGSVSVQDVATLERLGMAYVPITLNTSRGSSFRVDWEAVDGTATFGNDYTLASGTITWTKSGDGTKCIEIPLLKDANAESVERFTVRLTAGCGVNLSRTEATVLVADNDIKVAASACAESAAAAWTRVDMRTSLGGRIAHGVEKLGSVSGATASNWNTATTADGWVKKSDGGETVELLVRNDAGIAIEEGRLTADTAWTADRVHLVRNYVTVPSGVVLTIGEGTVVKFTENTAIRVEDGGKLNVVGSQDARVFMTVAEADDWGGDTDMRTAAIPSFGSPVWTQSSAASFTENSWLQTCYADMSGWGTVSVQAAQGYEYNGVVYVPITISGTRNKQFAVDWRAVDGTATYGNDYTLASGMVTWSKSSEGTKFIAIPLVSDNVREGVEHFRVELPGACGMNVSARTADVAIFDNEVVRQVAASGTGRVEQRDALVAKLVKGVWPLPYGAWQTNGVETARVRVTAKRRNGTGGETVLVDATPAQTDVLAWNTAALADGWWTLRHEELDGNGQIIEAWTNDVNIQQKVVAHEGGMTTNEVWQGHGLTHYLADDLTLWEGRRIEIEPGAIVKFDTGKGMTIETNATLYAVGTSAEPIVFTSVRDDTHGGDMDGGLYDEPQTGDWMGLDFATGHRSEVCNASVWYVEADVVPLDYSSVVTPDATFWQEHPEILAVAGGDAEQAKRLPSPGKSGKGKLKPNGEPMKVWEDYVAGTDPEDEDDQFTAKVEMVDGKPVITWEPALNDTASEKGVKTGKRTYRTLGKKNLGDTDWAEVKSGEESQFHFFKVTVEMP